jgi:secreted trypsin-like serine protease
MRYPAPNYIVQATAAKASSSKIPIIVAISVTVFLAVCGIAIGLGVGLGIGNKQDSTSGLSIKVDCNYNSSSCGCAATKPTFKSTKIINGYSATAHSWPWMVALYNEDSFRCGGFLAANYSFVITAAHCVYGVEQNSILIYAGVDALSSRATAQYRTVSNWQIHPNYYSSSTTTLNDIAVIKLSSSFDKNDNVALCCLPSSGTSLPAVGEVAAIAGWGLTVDGDTSSSSDTLLQALIQIQSSSSTCNVSSTSDTRFCAGYGTTDTCQGDSGGPVMTNINNLWTCTGIVSYGIGCKGSGYYTRVSYFRSFIDNATKYL